jgi:hypothetical protein
MPKSTPDSSFKAILLKEDYSERVIEEIWKWYDYKVKKGEVSY